MTFVFNAAIPAANNNPSVDQPDMLGNNIATNGILAVDHISFNTNNGGNHLQVHMPLYTSPTIINGSATQGSVIYGAAGVADIAHAQCYFKNATNTFLLSLIRAYATCDGTGAILGSQNVNVVSVVSGGMGIFNVTLTANSVTGTNFGVLVTSVINTTASGATAGYNYTGGATFQLQFVKLNGSGLANIQGFTFIVLQI